MPFQVCSIVFEKYIVYNQSTNINERFYERGGYEMLAKKLNEKASKTVARMAKQTLKVEANTNSCLLIYQPKAPKELSRFKK